MPLHGEYEPSTSERAREQVALYEKTGGREGNLQVPTGLPVVILTTLGAKSGKLRKAPVMRVEHDGAYAVVASKGGHPKDPGWADNLRAEPKAMLQDGPEPFDVIAHELSGDERELWWQRALEAFPNYADYPAKTGGRTIPIFLLERA